MSLQLLQNDLVFRQARLLCLQAHSFYEVRSHSLYVLGLKTRLLRLRHSRESFCERFIMNIIRC